ncbi:phosphoribosylformylglycinamidine cyclo-ligase [Paenisporosarcina cavernae]|uniref:Phosphoribosylformylglycinamidine cyclo-ligase n=1 Tax=Paenisporosarcina cavernae TaxID=2320858 RepID=A0A385YTX3_9BACL|nr:phosphoribosylformylglycinamidine cyclo-ligase [Paenisporosarcina cavernae]AYC30309.1 phosphoribosylformylglycinamidine cyclo-ligase [Paenisporosarcina cavernae]
MSNAYEKAGVNIEAGYEAVNRMKSHVARTARAGVLGTFGGFGGIFDLSSLNLKEPVLISGTDGVGTKLRLAFDLGNHSTIGIDCVAMCVNDIVAQGAEPLYFLDYLAVGKAQPAMIEQIVAGIADGCVQAGAALIGGETAEMPGFYEEDEYDVAGFAVGACEKSSIVTGEKIRVGDTLIGFSSSGVHSNGFSLVRKILADHQLSLNERIAGYDSLGIIGENLLTPTKMYAKSALAVLKEVPVHGMAHITGGGFIENLPRMMPEGLTAHIELGSWPVLNVFHFIKEKGHLQDADLYNVFNMGIGFVLAVASEHADRVIALAEEHGENAYVIGEVMEGTSVTFSGEHDGSLLHG